MKRFVVSVFRLMIVAYLLTGCNLTSDHAATSSHIAFDTLRIDTVLPLLPEYEKPACTFELSIQHPVSADTTETLTALQHFVSSMIFFELAEKSDWDIQKAAETYRDIYLKTYQEKALSELENYKEDSSSKKRTKKQHLNIEAAATWLSEEYRGSGKVEYFDESFLSYTYSVYNYTGGAHGMKIKIGGVFSLLTNSRVLLSDIFETVTPDVNSLLQRQLATQYGYETAEELTTRGPFFDYSKIAVTENFMLDSLGVVWMYQPYEIAPYSEGIISIRISWKDLLPYIPAKSCVQVLAQQSKR